MPTRIYLRGTAENVIADIKKLAPNYNGETDYSFGLNGVNGIHYMGRMLLSNPLFDLLGNMIQAAIFSVLEHANIYINDNTNISGLSLSTTFIPPPNSPSSGLAE